MKKDTEPITYKGRVVYQQVMRCSKCNEIVVSADEYERVRKELHPSLITRIKRLLFSKDSCLSEGKVL